MTDEEALRAAVLAHPDDDTPRLVYADWCDDAGHADRAAFIRAQIEAARAEPWSPAQRDAEARAAALRDQQVFEWTRSVGYPPVEPEFRRGFVEAVELPPAGIRSRLGTLQSVAPIRYLGLNDNLAASIADFALLEDLVTEPVLSTLLGLDLSGCGFGLADSTMYDMVSDTAPVAGLRELRIRALPVPPEWLTRFLAGDRIPALNALDLSDIPNLGPALAGGLQAAPHRRFTKLNFDGVRFLSGELQRVLASRALAVVEELRLGWPFPGPGPATMLELGWAVPWARLRLLDLAGQQLGPDGVKEITLRREAAGLRWLGLARNHLGSGGAEWLLESPHLNLYHLDVSDNGLSPHLLAALRARFPDALVVG